MHTCIHVNPQIALEAIKAGLSLMDLYYHVFIYIHQIMQSYYGHFHAYFSFIQFACL